MKQSPRNNGPHISQRTMHHLAALLKPYRSGWVAVTPDEREVVASAETLRETRELVKSNRVSDAVYIKVIPPNRGYIPHLQ